MNINFFIGGLSGGGAERVTCNLANYLLGEKHDVTILTMSDAPSTYYLESNVKRISLITNKERKCFLYNSLLRLVRLCNYLRNNKPDVIVVMLPITTILMLRLKCLTRAKVVASERVNPSSYPDNKQNQLKRLAHKADGWVFQTEEEKKWYGDTVGKALVKVIPNAMNNDFAKSIYVGERKKKIVTVGRLAKQKNHELLLKAFAIIYKDYQEYKLIIYGEGDRKESLTKLSNDLGIEKAVELPGYITNIGEIIKDASMFVLPSDYEGMPNALMEAMSLGIPCISTDCDGGGARFLIEDEKNGLLVSKGNVEELAMAMHRMLSDNEFAERCGKEAIKIRERLSPDKIYKEWERFLQGVIEGI